MLACLLAFIIMPIPKLIGKNASFAFYAEQLLLRLVCGWAERKVFSTKSVENGQVYKISLSVGVSGISGNG